MAYGRFLDICRATRWIEFRKYITKNQEGAWFSMGRLVVRNVSFKKQSGRRPTTRGERSLNDEKLPPWNRNLLHNIDIRRQFFKNYGFEYASKLQFVFLSSGRQDDRENYVPPHPRLIILRIIKFALMASSSAGIECVIDTESSMKWPFIFLKFNLSVCPILCVSFHRMLR